MAKLNRPGFLVWVVPLIWLNPPSEAADRAGAAAAHAASPAASRTRPSKSRPFHVSGVWVLSDTFMDKQDGKEVAAPGRASEGSGAVLPMYLQSPVLKGEYEAQRKKNEELIRKGTPVDDSGAMCLPQGMPDFWGGPYAFEFLQTDTQLNISQEWNEQTRRIYLDGRAHPKDYDPSFNGHSIGRWEGGVLVVDTIGIRAETGVQGAHHSDALHIIERIRQTAPDRLEVEMTAYDPKAFQQPWVAIYPLHHKPGMEIQEYSCEENNRNQVDENGVTRATISSK